MRQRPRDEPDGRPRSPAALDLALAVERERARRRRQRDALARLEHAVLGDADRRRRARARAATCEHAPGSRSRPSRTCSPRPPPRASGREQAGDRREPDRAGLGEGDEQLATAPRRATARARRRSARGSPRRRPARGRRRAVALDVERGLAHAARVAAAARWRPARWRARRPSPRASRGTRCWSRSRARRAARRRSALATTRCVPSPPSTTIARDARARASARRRACVSRGACRRARIVELLELRERRVAARAPRELAVQRRARARRPAGIISTRSTPAAPSPAQQPEDHAGLVGVAEHRRAGHQPADVAPGGRVGDDPDTRARRTRAAGYAGRAYGTTLSSAYWPRLSWLAIVQTRRYLPGLEVDRRLPGLAREERLGRLAVAASPARSPSGRSNCTTARLWVRRPVVAGDEGDAPGAHLDVLGQHAVLVEAHLDAAVGRAGVGDVGRRSRPPGGRPARREAA